MGPFKPERVFEPAPLRLALRIDAHQHFWKYHASDYPWIERDWPIRRDFLPADLEAELQAGGLDGSVAVQARQSVEESRWLLELADQWPMIKGVVGWVNLLSERVEEQLAEFANHRKFVGVRHVVQDEPDDDFMLRPDFLRGMKKLQRFQLAYDILIYPRQLPAAIELVRRFPEQRFVLDHLAKPRIKDRILEPWAAGIGKLATAPNLWCKISGMVTEARWRAWQPEDFRPYLDRAWEAFGENRLLVGSDWPVCLNSADYSQVMDLLENYLGQFSAEAREKVWGGNAIEAYRLERSFS